MKINDILKDMSNNNFDSLYYFLYERYKFDFTLRNHKYVGEKSIDIKFKHVIELRHDIFISAMDLLDSLVKKQYGESIFCIPMIMVELLPDRLGIELWVYELI